MINYFAYGSNMSPIRLNSRICSARKIGVFRLDQYDLRFHKVSKKDGSAKCDAFFTGSEEDFVFGVLYEISDEDKETLDKIEGLGVGYEEKIVAINAADQTQKAITYIAINIRENLLPYSWYLRHVLEGAKTASLPSTYIEKLKNVSTQLDVDLERTKKELSIYG